MSVESSTAERPCVLVVEDDRTLARGLIMNLELEGFRVLHAATGDEGLELALDGAPDVVVLDLMLPGLSGFELVRSLRERERATPVLVSPRAARSPTRSPPSASARTTTSPSPSA